MQDGRAAIFGWKPKDGGFYFYGDSMKLSGWIFMIISWTFILSLATFCFSRIFKKGLGGEDSEEPARGSKKKKEE